MSGPGPSCADGPARAGATIQGTPCDDVIVVPPGVVAVEAGRGDDTIVPAPVAAAESCPVACFLDIGSQTFDGGPGDDVVFGERGNDRLLGGPGNDRLFGGIGDDVLAGGPGNDLLSGGFGHDEIDGEAGDDYVRGDATVDDLADSGGGTDTISYSSGIAPGFFNSHPVDFSAVPGLPPLGGERGVYLDLSAAPESGNGDNGVAQFAGGVDRVDGSGFEVVVGTAFSDYIVGSDRAEVFYGGGGGDVILAGDGDDSLHGGAEGDHLDGGLGADVVDGGPGDDHCASAATAVGCDPAENPGGVVGRDQGKVAVGRMSLGGAGPDQLYLLGSEAADEVTATYSAGSPASVAFALGAGSAAPFDTDPAAAGGCDPPSGSQVVCQLSGPLDSVLLAGLGDDDELVVAGFPPTVGLVLGGGEGDDSLTGSDLGEDVLVGGTGDGDDVLEAGEGDDALTNNRGDDRLFGGAGNDLLVSDSICDADLLDGGSERDNASWTRYRDGDGVAVNLASAAAGAPDPAGSPSCPGGTLASLVSIEDLEGTPQDDFFSGDGEDNQLLGWVGADTYRGGAGQDRILANSGDFDPPVECGPGVDTALIDFAGFGDLAEPDCENVREAAANSFRVEPPVAPPQEPPLVPGPLQQPQGDGAKLAPERGRAPRPNCLGARSPGMAGPTRCTVRPHRLRVSGGLVERLRWRNWGPRRAVGVGRFVAAARGRLGGARVVADRSRDCGARSWYTRVTVAFGPRFRAASARRARSPAPCATRLRRDGNR